MAQQIIMPTSRPGTLPKETYSDWKYQNPFAMNTLKTIIHVLLHSLFMMVANGYAQKTDSINTEAGKSVLHRNAIYIPPALEQ